MKASSEKFNFFIYYEKFDDLWLSWGSILNKEVSGVEKEGNYSSDEDEDDIFLSLNSCFFDSKIKFSFGCDCYC